MKHLKIFETTAEYNTFKLTENFVTPNVSLCEDAPTVTHYEPYIAPIAPQHEYVEIGGIKWATMNVGALAITDTGLYFQWGGTQGYTAAQVGSGEGQKYFGWTDYKYGGGESNPSNTSMTKYSPYDGKKVLEASDDAVTAAWGGAWRMPTRAEFQALSAATTSVWTTNYEGSSIRGLVLTSTADSSKKLFFPACGTSIDGVVNSGGKYGYYWSSSLESSGAMYADIVFFDKNSVNWQTYMSRCCGMPVRGVYVG